MVSKVFIFLSRTICLVLVLATGFSGIAFASHDGSHGSHCIETSQEDTSAAHQHSAGQQDAAAGSEGSEQSCVQHSCVAVVASVVIDAYAQHLASDIVTLRGHLLRASISVESLHRPPIA